MSNKPFMPLDIQIKPITIREAYRISNKEIQETALTALGYTRDWLWDNQSDWVQPGVLDNYPNINDYAYTHTSNVAYPKGKLFNHWKFTLGTNEHPLGFQPAREFFWDLKIFLSNYEMFGLEFLSFNIHLGRKNEASYATAISGVSKNDDYAGMKRRIQEKFSDYGFDKPEPEGEFKLKLKSPIDLFSRKWFKKANSPSLNYSYVNVDIIDERKGHVVVSFNQDMPFDVRVSWINKAMKNVPVLGKETIFRWLKAPEENQPFWLLNEDRWLKGVPAYVEELKTAFAQTIPYPKENLVIEIGYVHPFIEDFEDKEILEVFTLKNKNLWGKPLNIYKIKSWLIKHRDNNLHYLPKRFNAIIEKRRTLVIELEKGGKK